MMDFDRIRRMLERHEGYRDRLYKCSAGKWTIGVGHNIEDLGLPKKIIYDLLDHDIGLAIIDCASLYPNWNSLSENIQTVLIDMMFNMGKTRLQKFKKMNRAVEDFNWPRMAKEMEDSAWFRQVGNRAKELQELVLEE